MRTGPFEVYMSGHVLHLRGELTAQPRIDSSGSALLWNGEAYYIDDSIVLNNDTAVRTRVEYQCLDCTMTNHIYATSGAF